MSIVCLHRTYGWLQPVISLVPRPSSSFPSLAVQLSDGKLGEGLGMRLTSYCMAVTKILELSKCTCRPQDSLTFSSAYTIRLAITIVVN